MKTIASLLLSLCLFANALIAQHGILTVRKVVELSEESKGQVAKFEVVEGASKLQLSVSALIRKGKVDVILYDPKGRKMGKLSLGSDDKDSSQFENGKLDLAFENAQKGEWEVKIIPIKAEGQVVINSKVTLVVENE